MIAPQLWVWVGSNDDELDVMRYVKATDQDILHQPTVDRLRVRLDRLRAALQKMAGDEENADSYFVRLARAALEDDKR